MIVLLWMSVLGCSIRGTVSMVKAEQAYQQALSKRRVNKDNSDEIFIWTMATAYMKKSREEYSNADYQQSELLAEKAQSWLLKWNALKRAEKQAKEQSEKSNSTEPKKLTKPAPKKKKEK